MPADAQDEVNAKWGEAARNGRHGDEIDYRTESQVQADILAMAKRLER
jgi:hypothetical protein